MGNESVIARCDHAGEKVAFKVNNQFIQNFSLLPNKVGIFGGSFDPVQKAHITVAKEAQRSRGLEAIVFIPAKQNPLKLASTGADAEQRVRMLEYALLDLLDFYISRIEITRDSDKSFTVDTLRSIKRQMRSEQEIHLIIGSDNLHTLHKWRDVHEIFSLCQTITSVNRETSSPPDFFNLPGLSKEFRKSLKENFIQIPTLTVSSTDVRAAIAQGDIPADALHPKVIDYISEQGLYRSSAARN